MPFTSHTWTSLRVSIGGASLTTILAALRVFQGNAAVEAGVWLLLTSGEAAIRSVGGYASAGEAAMVPFFVLAASTSVMPMLRSGVGGTPNLEEFANFWWRSQGVASNTVSVLLANSSYTWHAGRQSAVSCVQAM